MDKDKAIAIPFGDHPIDGANSSFPMKGTLRIYTEITPFSGQFSGRLTKITLAVVHDVAEWEARLDLQSFRASNMHNVTNIHGVWIPDAITL